MTKSVEYDCPKQIAANHEPAYFDTEYRLMTAIAIDQMRDADLITGKPTSHEIDPPQINMPLTDAQQEIWQKSIEQRQGFNMATYPHNQRFQEMGIPTPSPLKIADPAVEIDQNTLRGKQEDIRETLSNIQHNLGEDFGRQDDAGEIIRRAQAKRAENKHSQNLGQEPDQEPER